MQFRRIGYCLVYCIITFLFISCSEKNSSTIIEYSDFGTRCKPLITTRFKDLDHLKTVVKISHDRDYSKLDSSESKNSSVRLVYTSNGETIDRTLHSGTKQSDLQKIQKADFLSKLSFLFNNPYAVRERKALELFHMMSRRRADIFGSNDKAFYNLAELSFRNINSLNAFYTERDSSEKGYINTFNHITAQAIITSFFSEELADLIGDLHERSSMTELTSGQFTIQQLQDTFNTPMDNYIDIINNEIGQRLGRSLRLKYQINENTISNPQLITKYLNDLQLYYMWSFGIGMNSFHSSDEKIIIFSNKFNYLLKTL